MKLGRVVVFVFGSNLAGRHGKGAALAAKRDYGAEYGKAIGRTGNAYAIPTKDHNLRPLPLDAIRTHVEAFIAYAEAHPEVDFLVTRVGCGLARFTDAQMAPLFRGAPANCRMPEEWNPWLYTTPEKNAAAKPPFLGSPKSKKTEP